MSNSSTKTGNNIIPRFTDDDWAAILALRQGIPVAEFPFALKKFKRHVFRLADHVYAESHALPDILDGNPVDTLRITTIIWANSDIAASAAGHLVRSVDHESLREHGIVPPSELLGARALSWKNKDTYAAAKRLPVIAERAQYNGDGEFQFKVVALPPLQVYYASRKKNDKELPFAVVVILPKENPRRVAEKKKSPPRK